MRFRIIFVAALASLTLCAVGVPAAGAANGTSKVTSTAPLYTLPVTGMAKNNKKFNGKFGIQRYTVATLNHKRGVYAVGTLTGTLKGRHVTRYNVMIPASLTGAPTGQAKAAAVVPCPVLHLVLGPINLNLLGLVVTLGGGNAANLPIVLDITAVPGAGNLLGNLLCGLTNALNPAGGGGLLSSLNTQLQQLSATLTGLTALLGGL
jgi:hypothetical protein